MTGFQAGRFGLVGAMLAAVMLSAGCVSPKEQELAADSAYLDRRERVLAGALQQAVDHVLQNLPAGDGVLVMLVGELHDNVQHQAFERALVTALAQRYPRGRIGVVLEMLAHEDQPRIDAAVAQARPAAQWPGFVPVSSGWAWPAYAGVIDAALQAGAHVYGGNLSTEQARDIVRRPQSWQQGLSTVWADWQQSQIRQAVEQGHCGMMPPALVPGMVLAQRWRDQIMASTLLRLASSYDALVLIAGAQHVRRDWAIGWLLAQSAATTGAPVLRLRSIALGEHDDDLKGQSQPKDPWVWDIVTQDAVYDMRLNAPKVQRGDPCAVFQTHRPPRR